MIDHTFAILAHGDSPYIERCIQSINEQKVRGKVIICTSTESNYINRLGLKYNIRIFVNKESTGIADDWNYALHQSRTNFVTLTHQDDIYRPDYLSVISHHFSREFLILFTNYFNCDEKVKISINTVNRIKSFLLWPFIMSDSIHHPLLKRMLIQFGNPICCPGVVYNKENLQGFEFSNDYSNNLDWFAWLQLAETPGNFIYISRRLFNHRVHGDSVTAKSLTGNIKEIEDEKMFKLLWGGQIYRIIQTFYKISYYSYKRR